MARRVGILVNPDAGLGGRLGFKGSDGRAAEARAAGAEDRSGPRMRQTIERFHNRFSDVEILTCSGRMGSDWISIDHTIVFETPEETSAQTTRVRFQYSVNRVSNCCFMQEVMGPREISLKHSPIPNFPSLESQVVSRCTVAVLLPLQTLQQRFSSLG